MAKRRKRRSGSGRRSRSGKPCGCPAGSVRKSTRPKRGGGKARGWGSVCVETVPADFSKGKKRATRFVKPRRC